MTADRSVHELMLDLDAHAERVRSLKRSKQRHALVEALLDGSLKKAFSVAWNMLPDRRRVAEAEIDSLKSLVRHNDANHSAK